jgi:UPF0271 protein
VPEFYADLEYDGNGQLVITRQHKAISPEWAAQRTLRAVTEGKTLTTAGTDVPVRASTVCVHSDTPNAVDIAKAVRSALAEHLALS